MLNRPSDQRCTYQGPSANTTCSRWFEGLSNADRIGATGVSLAGYRWRPGAERQGPVNALGTLWRSAVPVPERVLVDTSSASRLALVSILQRPFPVAGALRCSLLVTGPLATRGTWRDRPGHREPTGRPAAGCPAVPWSSPGRTGRRAGCGREAGTDPDRDDVASSLITDWKDLGRVADLAGAI